jgi:hypothetical protein
MGILDHRGQEMGRIRAISDMLFLRQAASGREDEMLTSLEKFVIRVLFHHVSTTVNLSGIDSVLRISLSPYSGVQVLQFDTRFRLFRIDRRRSATV